MALVPPPRNDKSIWYGPEISKRKKDWIFHLTEDEIKELEAGGKELAKLSPSDEYISLEALNNLDLSKFSKVKERIDGFIEILHNGQGFFLWKGLPVHKYSRKENAAIFLIIGKLMGNLRQQNADGHILGHVTDLGLSSNDPNIRVYQTNERQTFHADSCDVVGLLCLRTAASGGLSSLVSSGTMYNEMLKIAPDLAKELLKPIPTDRRGETAKDGKSFYEIPVYTEYKGYLSAKYQRQYIESSQRFPEAPRITEKQIIALNLFDALANDPRLNFTMELEPGDLQFVHNHTLLHDRTGWKDWDEPDKKRYLLRMWLAPSNGRPLHPVFAEQFGSVEPGNRGGVGLDNEGIKDIAPIYVTKNQKLMQ